LKAEGSVLGNWYLNAEEAEMKATVFLCCASNQAKLFANFFRGEHELALVAGAGFQQLKIVIQIFHLLAQIPGQRHSACFINLNRCCSHGIQNVMIHRKMERESQGKEHWRKPRKAPWTPLPFTSLVAHLFL